FAHAGLFFREYFFVYSLVGYLPVLLFTLSRLLDDKSSLGRWIAVIACTALISQTAFASQLIPWPAATLFFWFAFVERRKSLLDWALIAGVALAMMAGRWQDVVALISYAPLSALADFRTTGSLGEEWAKAGILILRLAEGPHYLSLAFIAFGAISLTVVRSVSRWGLMLTFPALALAIFCATTAKVLMVDHLPFLSALNATRIAQGFHLFVTLAGGVGLQVMAGAAFNPLRSGKAGKGALMTGLVVALTVGTTVFGNLDAKFRAARDWITWGNLRQTTENPVLESLALRLRANPPPPRVLGFQMHGALLTAYGLETVAGYHPMMSRRYRDYWWEMTTPWHSHPEWAKTHGAGELGSLTTILPATRDGAGDEAAARQARWDLEAFVNGDLLALLNVGYVVSRDELSGAGLEKLEGPDRSWNSLTQKEKILTQLRANFSGEGPLFIYRLPAPLPRAFTVASLTVLADGAAVLAALGNADRATLADTAYGETGQIPASLDGTTSFTQRPATVTRYEPDRIEVALGPGTGPALLVVTNSFSPFWRAEVDGIEAPIFPVDHAFWGLALPDGTQKVVFSYHAPYR
ncbi:MAG: hypothetical protein ACPGNT_11220, partial [Rhodospirillales bacterium]